MRKRVVGVVASVAFDRRRARLREVACFETFEADAQVFVEFPAVRRTHVAINGTIRQSVFVAASMALARRRFGTRRRILLCGCIDGCRGHLGRCSRLVLVGAAVVT